MTKWAATLVWSADQGRLPWSAVHASACCWDVNGHSAPAYSSVTGVVGEALSSGEGLVLVVGPCVAGSWISFCEPASPDATYTTMAAAASSPVAGTRASRNRRLRARRCWIRASP